MAQENIKGTLPISGLEYELLPYVTHKLSQKVSKVLMGNNTYKMSEIQKEADFGRQVNEDLEVRMTDMLDSGDIRVLGMLAKLGDKIGPEITAEDIDILPQKDYEELAKKTNEIFASSEELSSPKD